MAILTTPLDIYNQCLERFPDTQVDLESTSTGLTMTLFLSKEVIPLKLQSAVTTREFVQALNQLFEGVEWAKQTQSKVSPVNPESFDTDIPLEDKQRFQRVMYEKTGRSCMDAIIEYLQNPVDLTVLRKLGFAPEQVEEKCTEGDLAYFQTLPERCKHMRPEIQKTIRDNFMRIFPKSSHLVMVKIDEKEHARQRAVQVNEYARVCDDLQSRVIGQKKATEKLAATLISQKRKTGKNQVYLFVGPTGVGKTELAKAVGKLKQNRFVNFSMNQYPSEFHVSKFVGSAAGYMGSTDRPFFAKAFDRFSPIRGPVVPNASDEESYIIENVVILFDEFEKAHSVIKQSLLTVFDEGWCSLSYTNVSSSAGRTEKNIDLKYIFKDCIIISTSNLFQEELLESFREGKTTEEISARFVEMNKDFPQENTYSSELLGRVAVIPFGPIPKGQPYQTVIKLKMKECFAALKDEFACREISVENEPLVLAAIETKLYGKGVNLRGINRFFEDFKNKLDKEKDALDPMDNTKLTLQCDREGLCIRISRFMHSFFGVYCDVGVIRLID